MFIKHKPMYALYFLSFKTEQYKLITVQFATSCSLERVAMPASLHYGSPSINCTHYTLAGRAPNGEMTVSSGGQVAGRPKWQALHL